MSERTEIGISPLGTLSALKTFYISQEYEPLVNELGDIGFEVCYTKAVVMSWEELKAAS